MFFELHVKSAVLHFHSLDLYWLKKFSRKNDIPCVYNSDAHYIETLKDAYNVCDVEGELTQESLFEAIKAGECSHRINNFIKYYYFVLARNIFFVRPLAAALY